MVTDPNLSVDDREVLGRACAVVRLVPDAACDELVRMGEEFGGLREFEDGLAVKGEDLKRVRELLASWA